MRIWVHGLEQICLVAITHLFTWQSSSAATTSTINHGFYPTTRSTSFCGTGCCDTTKTRAIHQSYHHLEHTECSVVRTTLQTSTKKPTTLPVRASSTATKKHDIDHSIHDPKTSSCWPANLHSFVAPAAFGFTKSSRSTLCHYSHWRCIYLFLCSIKKSSCHVTIPHDSHSL